MGGQRYDHPSFLTVHQYHSNGQTLTNSAPAVASNFINSTLKVWNKALVAGCTIVIASGASVGGAVSIGIRRTDSIAQKFTLVVSATTSCAGDVWDLSLTNGLTLLSIGENVTLALDTALTIADRGFVIQDIIWRYRLLPQDLASNFKLG